ncbi:cold-shock protein [bacterium]|nr:MAG: cold-shock protein [bacterium]
MPKGRVKRFDEKKGYGFIETEESEGKDVFVHYSDIQGDGFKTLVPGEEVEFDLIESDKGLKAVNVQRTLG